MGYKVEVDNRSWMTSSGVKLLNIEWHKDELGDYWVSDFVYEKDGKTQKGITGSYYDILDNGKRLSKAEQENELKEWGVL